MKFTGIWWKHMQLLERGGDPPLVVDGPMARAQGLL